MNIINTPGKKANDFFPGRVPVLWERRRIEGYMGDQPPCNLQFASSSPGNKNAPLFLFGASFMVDQAIKILFPFRGDQVAPGKPTAQVIFI
jgi:hypothetical protein